MEKNSGPQPELWDVRLIDTLEKCEVRYGWAFQRSRKQMGISEVRPYLFDMLLKLQIDRPDMIHSDIDVLEDFGLA